VLKCQFCGVMKNTTGRKRGVKLEPIARKLFIDGGYIQKEIAEYLGVSEVTISKWRKDFKWDVEKNRSEVSPSRLMANLYSQIQKILDALGENPMDSKTAMQIKIISSTIKELDKKIDPVVVIDVFKGFTNWLKTIDLEKAKLIVDPMREYVQTLANED
jgi:transposase